MIPRIYKPVRVVGSGDSFSKKGYDLAKTIWSPKKHPFNATLQANSLEHHLARVEVGSLYMNEKRMPGGRTGEK